MDVFKQNRYLWLTIIFLVLMNMVTLTLLWIGRPPGPNASKEYIQPEEEQIRIENLLNKELGFNESQIKQYLQLRNEHRQKAVNIITEIDSLKREMFDRVLDSNAKPVLSDSLLTLTQTKQAELEHITFQHFIDLKNLCGPEQKEKLRILMREVFRQNPPQRTNDDVPAPPPRGREHP